MSYFDICAASGDRVSDQVASAIRGALAGHLPGSLTVELPCHSPRTEPVPRERYLTLLGGAAGAAPRAAAGPPAPRGGRLGC